MPARKTTNGVPKNAVRTALITAATIATIMGAQTLAFSQKANQDLDLTPTSIAMQSTDTPYPDTSIATESTAIDTPTELPTETELPSASASATATAVPSATATVPATNTATATKTTTKTTTATATATKAVTATKVATATAAKVTTTVRQPAPRTQSSKR